MVATTAQTNSCNALGQIGINVPTHHVAITKYRFATIVDLVAMAQGWAFGQQATNASRIVESTQAMPHQTLRSIFFSYFDQLEGNVLLSAQCCIGVETLWAQDFTKEVFLTKALAQMNPVILDL